jgi:alkanesulfonate monooxygenase SsuD/methylene tetrahydromethanopterin reductase-like flavin-dependent oxidoreductase (luciferase family)
MRIGLSYDHPGRNTEEYLRITALLRGEDADLAGHDWPAHTQGRGVQPRQVVPVLVAALGPRLLRVAGELADGEAANIEDVYPLNIRERKAAGGRGNRFQGRG